MPGIVESSPRRMLTIRAWIVSFRHRQTGLALDTYGICVTFVPRLPGGCATGLLAGWAQRRAPGQASANHRIVYFLRLLDPHLSSSAERLDSVQPCNCQSGAQWTFSHHAQRAHRDRNHAQPRPDRILQKGCCRRLPPASITGPMVIPARQLAC